MLRRYLEKEPRNLADFYKLVQSDLGCTLDTMDKRWLLRLARRMGYWRVPTKHGWHDVRYRFLGKERPPEFVLFQLKRTFMRWLQRAGEGVVRDDIPYDVEDMAKDLARYMEAFRKMGRDRGT